MGKPDAQDLLRLADEVAAATGPDRELDADIACAIGRPLGNIEHWLHGDDISYQPTSHGYYVAVIPTENGDTRTSEAFKAEAYTASLDAAMTLIKAPFHHIEVCPPQGRFTGWTVHIVPLERGIFNTITGYAATYALAITAAALKARAHSTKETSNG